MARDKSNKHRGVQFTHESARAIADVVRQASVVGRTMPGISHSRNSQAASHYLSKTTEKWLQGTTQTLTIYVDGSPVTGETVEATNQTGGDVDSNMWVLLGRCSGKFYLVEPEVMEQDVITSVSLESTGLVFKLETIYVVGRKSNAPNDITIDVTECSTETQ